MSRLFALADLHLSLSGDKPMDVFGEQWIDHGGRMAVNWDARVGQQDVVLLPGDLSWARSLEQAAPDLEWIGARPGRKLLLRGNHDSWWRSATKVRRALPEGCELLQNNSIALESCVIVGARGWTSPDDPVAEPSDEKIFLRELQRLEASVADADRRFGRDLSRVAMLHYPPWLVGRPPGPVVDILHRADVQACVFGHLHGEDHSLAVTGTHEGIRYLLVASDAVDFAPVPIDLGIQP